ncbi:MAG: Fic family protein, partial [Aeromonas sp.]
HKISDQNMALNQAKAWEFLFAVLAKDEFCVNQDTVLAIHAIAAAEEALVWGEFRNGYVSIAGSEYEPPTPDELPAYWLALEQMLTQQHDIYDRAISAFLQMARMQFFWDVNKRTGRFIMNGILLAGGWPIINVPAKRQQEFNTLMLDFYQNNDMTAMNKFLRSCLNEKIMRNFLPKK